MFMAIFVNDRSLEIKTGFKGKQLQG